jgi:hypothetical protein
MPYHPVFDNNCFGAPTRHFIPAFKSPPKLALSNSEATSHGFGFEGPDEREAHKKLRARKDQLRKLADSDNVVKYDKFHAVNLIPRPSPMMFNCDVVVTAVTCTQPTPSFFINSYPTPHLPPIVYNPTPDKCTQATHVMPTPSVPEHKNDERKRATLHTPQLHLSPVQENRRQARWNGKGRKRWQG